MSESKGKKKKKKKRNHKGGVGWSDKATNATEIKEESRRRIKYTDYPLRLIVIKKFQFLFSRRVIRFSVVSAIWWYTVDCRLFATDIDRLYKQGKWADADRSRVPFRGRSCFQWERRRRGVVYVTRFQWEIAIYACIRIP